jgi:hypothetical protein
MSDDTIINTFWQGAPLPPLMWACMRSFVYHGHRIRVFSYNDLVVPHGVRLEDANDVLPQGGASANYRTIAQHADIFRYELLHRFGGWWVDTDVYCLTSTLPLQPYAWAEQEPGVINNAILKFPKGDALCSRLRAKAVARFKRSKGLGQLLDAALARRADARHWRALRRLFKIQLDWDDLGPKLVTEVLGGCQEIHKSGSQSAFYPWHWLEASFVWLPRARQVLENRQKQAVFLHFWTHTLRSMGIDMYLDPPSNSFLTAIIQGCPNRVPSDARDHVATERSICAFMRQAWVTDRWRANLNGNPNKFFAESCPDGAL